MFKISKQIEFDYGHRVPDHGSQCYNPHGHRGKVIAHCQAESLIEEGEQSGMVLDFGFLKNVLQDQIHNLFDHNFLIYKHDKIMHTMFNLSDKTLIRTHPNHEQHFTIETHSTAFEETRSFRVIVLPRIPTAENLAFLSYWLMKNWVKHYSEGNAQLVSVEFYETPTSSAIYTP